VFFNQLQSPELEVLRPFVAGGEFFYLLAFLGVNSTSTKPFIW
jgi:hypothetical protein